MKINKHLLQLAAIALALQNGALHVRAITFTNVTYTGATNRAFDLQDIVVTNCH